LSELSIIQAFRRLAAAPDHVNRWWNPARPFPAGFPPAFSSRSATAIRRRVSPKALVIYSLRGLAQLPGSDLPLGGRADTVGPPGQPCGQLKGITQLSFRHGHGQIQGLVSQIPAAERGQQVLIFGNAAGFFPPADRPPVLDLPGQGATPSTGARTNEHCDGPPVDPTLPERINCAAV